MLEELLLRGEDRPLWTNGAGKELSGGFMIPPLVLYPFVLDIRAGHGSYVKAGEGRSVACFLRVPQSGIHLSCPS
jgi:hypothetical protein